MGVIAVYIVKHSNGHSIENYTFISTMQLYTHWPLDRWHKQKVDSEAKAVEKIRN